MLMSRFQYQIGCVLQMCSSHFRYNPSLHNGLREQETQIWFNPFSLSTHSIDSYGFISIPIDSYGFCLVPVDSYGFLCIPMDFCGSLCIPKDYYVMLWIHVYFNASYGIFGFLWTSMHSYGILCISMVYHGFLWISVELCGSPHSS